MKPLQKLVTVLAGRGPRRALSALPLLSAFRGPSQCGGP